MVTPGLYRHYKSTEAAPKLYRVLFVVPWWSHGAILKPDTPLYVAAYDDGIGIRTSPSGGSEPFLKALWSGNGDLCPGLDEYVVVYVALYGDGRVSVRTVKEFEALVPNGDNAHLYQKSLVSRFERIGD